jgi:GNAT superfamily N-acetyltransferase
MVVDLAAVELPSRHAAPAGVGVAPLDCDAEGIALAAASATSPEHVDSVTWSGIDRAEYWRSLLDGKGPCGAVLPAASALLRRTGEGIVGAVVVTDMEATAWWAGEPWLPELFVVANLQGQGLGALLLEHALRGCGDVGCAQLGLTVTEGNPARRLYERLWFRAFRATWLIELGHTADA